MRFNHWMSVAALALLASPLAAEEYVVKEYLLPAPINWTTGNGPEAPGAEVAPLAGESTLRLTGDFRHGGNYVSFFKDFNTHLNLSEIRFQAKTAAPYLLLRLTDSDWQVHQYQLPLSGIGYAVGELTISIQFVDITIIVFCNSGIPFIGSHVVVASESHCYQSLVIYVQETCVWINFFYFRQLH